MAIPGTRSQRWCKKQISPWWKDHRELEYINEPFNDPTSLDIWKKLGYTQTRFTGDMYDMRNPEPQWIDPFRKIFPWRYFSWSVYRMGPGTVLPQHSDTYQRFREIYGVTDIDSIYRAIVFLEPWQSGHYFEIDSTPIVSWAAGDTVIWHSDLEHVAANMGITDRYTLQITGVPDENPFI